MLDFLVEFFVNYGYLSVFLVLLLCGFGIPIPEDITLVAAGVIAALACDQRDTLFQTLCSCPSVHNMFFISMAGVLAGDSVMFLLGRFFGQNILENRIFKRLVTPERYKLVDEKFARYGSRVVFVARFMPGLRAPIFLTAGITRQVSFLRFLITDFSAAIISVPVWVYLGFWGTQKSENIMLYIKKGQMGIFIILGVLILTILFLWGYKKYKARKEMSV